MVSTIKRGHIFILCIPGNGTPSLSNASVVVVTELSFMLNAKCTINDKKIKRNNKSAITPYKCVLKVSPTLYFVNKRIP